jgi:hypothetical protein
MSLQNATPLRESQHAVRRSSDLRRWHLSLRTRCERSIASALETCDISFGLRDDPAPPSLTYVFYLRANIGDESRLAIWRGERLLIHPELAQRAEVLVRLGETFEVPELGSSVLAGFDEPLQAAITLMRAADRILEFDFRLEKVNLTYRTRSGS